MSMTNKDVEDLKSSISASLKELKNLNTKEDCIKAILGLSYMLTIEMNKNMPSSAEKLRFNCIIGWPLALIQTMVDDKGMLDEVFPMALASKAHEYYIEYVKDLDRLTAYNSKKGD